MSDGSSDVCSSDLAAAAPPGHARDHRPAARARQAPQALRPSSHPPSPITAPSRHRHWIRPQHAHVASEFVDLGQRVLQRRFPPVRTEEHTYELQSLIRISYTVLCLKKKKLQHQV